MSGTLLYEVRRVRGNDEMAAALELRHDVFCVEQGVPEHEELDGRDHEGIHLVAVANGELVGTCRVLMVGTTAQFSRLAVSIAHQMMEQNDYPFATPDLVPEKFGCGLQCRAPPFRCITQIEASSA